MKKFATAFSRKINLLVMLPLLMVAMFAIGSYGDKNASDSVNTVVAAASIAGLGFGARRHLRLSPENGGGNGEATLLEKIKNTVIEQLKTYEANPDSNMIKELNAIKESMKSAVTQAEVKAIQEKFDALALDMKANMEKATKSNIVGKSIRSQVGESLKAKSSDIAAVAKNRSGSVEFDINLKAAGTFTESNVDAVGTGISILLADIEPGITVTPSARPNVIQYLNRGTMTGAYVVYAEMKNNDGGAGMTSEGSAKTQMDFDFVEAKSDARKVTSYIKTSKEALSDITELNTTINGELMTLLMNKLEDQVLEGSGTPPDLDGLNDTTNVSTAFSAGNFANTIADANIYDVVNAAASQIMTAEVVSGRPAGFMPNIVILNPEDIIKLKLTKDTNGQYLFPVSLPGTPNIAGLTVVASPWLTVDKFIVADSTKINFRVREDVNISIGYENDDFTKNLVTILAEARVAMFVKSNHKKAIVYGDITDAIVALDPAT